jgi:hypothetical protein
MKILRGLAPFALLAGLSGCGLFVETAANSIGIPSPSKVVTEKVPPDVLIAFDGMTCKVPEERFGHIEVGQSITCVWMGTPHPGK